jgi:oligoendopeptidase F
MNRIDFQTVPRYQPRQYVPHNADLENVETVTSLYQELMGRELTSDEAFQAWFQDKSELEIVLDEVGARLYIEMTCHTDDLHLSDRYKAFIESVLPVTKDYEHQLNQKHLSLAEQFPLKTGQYEIYERSIKTDIDIFVKENIDLQTKVQVLCQEYQKIMGAMTVELDGQEKTLVEASKALLNPERHLRRTAWEAITQRRLEDKDALNGLFDELLGLRTTIAQNARFKGFTDYQFKAYHRFDYTVDQCKAFHRAVEKVVVPLWKEILDKRRCQMKLELLRPWDTAVDPTGLPALNPFSNTEELTIGCSEILTRIDPDFGKSFQRMSAKGYLDLDNRKGKAPGGYQSSLNEARKPFIFMNAVGTDKDVKTLLHEAGHAMHTLACAHQPILYYLHAPMEFCEVASMSMEMLALPHLSVFYPKSADQRRSVIQHLEDVVFILLWVATIDAFQHWIYENPFHSVSQREKAWLEIRERFAGDTIDWTDHEEAHRILWQKQLHIFEVPFYYIEYGIAQLGALQIWLKSRKTYAQAIARYKASLTNGGACSLRALFDRAGIDFDFSAKTIAPLMGEVKREWERLWASANSDATCVSPKK